MMQLENTAGRTPRELAREIIATLNQRWNLDLEPLLANEALSVAERRRRLTARILEAALQDIDAYNAREGIESDPEENDRLMARVNGSDQSRASEDDDISIEPNISLTQKNFTITRGYTGQQVYDYVYTLSKRMESMANAKTPGQLAIEIGGSSLFSIGVAMSKLTWSAWRAGQPFLTALRTGITTLGMKTAITVVVIVLAAFLLYLFLENPKKILGIVYNDTDNNFVVSNWRQGADGKTAADINLFVQHGHIENFPQDRQSGDLDSPIVQLRQRFFFAKDDPDNVVFGGVYFADRNFGLRGSEGIMVFTPLENDGPKFAHIYAVPYTNDNGTNMRLLTGARPPLEDLYRDMYNQRKVRVDFTDGGYRFVATVNDARGGVVGLLASISQV